MHVDELIGSWRFIPSVAVITASIVLAAALLFFDGDPPSFPLPQSADPIDCLAIKNAKIWGEKSRIKVSAELGNFIQYPKQVASSLLRVVVQLGNMSFQFSPERFWDLESNLKNLSFCVLQSVGGKNMSIELYCQKNLLARNKASITDVQIYPVGWSRRIPVMDLAANLRDICFDNSSQLVFFSQPKTIAMDHLQLTHNFTVPIIISKDSAEQYRKNRGYSLIRDVSIFVSETAETSTDILFRVIIPLWGSYFHSFDKNSYEIVLMQPSKQANLINNMAPLAKRTIQKTVGSKCFTAARFVRGVGYRTLDDSRKNVSYMDDYVTQISYAYDFKSDCKKGLRNKFVGKSAIVKGKIVVDSGLKDIAEKIKEKYQECTVCVINETATVQENARAVASANMLISGHVKSHLWGWFLSQNSTLIEVMPDGNEGTRHGEVVALDIGAKYLAIGNHPVDKTCTTFHCYLEKPTQYTKLKIEDVFAAINQAIL